MKPSDNVISIITPSYNQGNFIEDAITSVLKQEGDFYIDYLIMDGGSTDKTLDTIKKYEHLLHRGQWDIKCNGIFYNWESQKDNGPVEALHKGMQRIRGAIFTWLNSDDYFLSNDVLKTIHQEFNKGRSLQMVTADGLIVDINGNEIGKHQVSRINKTELLYLDYHILQPATFLRTSILDTYSLNPKYKCAFDLDFFNRIILNGEPYIKLAKPFSAFRMWDVNITARLYVARYLEEMIITHRLSGAPFYYVVSALYRITEIIVKTKVNNIFQNNRFILRLFNSFFYFIRNLSYIVITGNSYRKI